MMALAPSSPRLPSPPPTAEIQIGPASPSGGMMAQRQLSEAEALQHELNSKRRVHPGTKSADVAAGPPLMPLNELDSAFQLQEHLAALHYYHSQSRTQPITRTTAIQLATPPAQTDRTLWLYELCRFLISQCNSLIVGFLFDTPPCSATTCPEMRASEWQFLCAVHEQPKSCCAIDYCCHTLDWAANVVTDPKIFPSRLVALQDAHSRSIAMKNLVNVFRRLHRIFAHAWFQHRSVFWMVENQTGLYVFFKTACDMYDLLPGETYKLPPEAEGLEGDNKPSGGAGGAGAGGEKKSSFAGGVAPGAFGRQHHGQKSEGGLLPGSDEDNPHSGVGKTNTRRHIRSSPSTGSTVTTVMEADEEEGGSSERGYGKTDAASAASKPQDSLAGKMKDLQISASGPGEEEPADAEEVPVMVEPDVVEASTPSGVNDQEIEEPATAMPGDVGRSKQEEFPIPEEPILPPEDAKLQKTTTSTSDAVVPSEDKTDSSKEGEKEGDEPAKISPTSEDADDSESEERVNTPDSGSTAADADISVHDFVDPALEAAADAPEAEKEQETSTAAAEPPKETKEEKEATTEVEGEKK